MTIHFLGSGSVATLYGWAFAQAGHAVEYVGPEDEAPSHLEFLDARKFSSGKSVSEPWLPTIRNDLPAETDLVIMTAPYHELDRALASLSSPSSVPVLVLGNVWDDPIQLAARYPKLRIVWAFPSAGGTTEDGVFSGALLANVHLGVGTEHSEEVAMVGTLLRESGFHVAEHQDMRGWLWLQFAVGAGMAAQALDAGSVLRLLNSPVQLRNAILLIRELFAVVAARGVSLAQFPEETKPFQVPAWFGGLVLQTTLGTQAAVRAVWESGDDEERVQMVKDALAEARRLEVAVPRLSLLERLL